MANMAHIAETAGLLLLAYAAGAVVGFGLRRLVNRARPSRSAAEAVPSPEVLPPVVRPADVPVFAAPAAAPAEGLAIVPVTEPVLAPVAADDVVPVQPPAVNAPPEALPEPQIAEPPPPAESAAAPLAVEGPPADQPVPPRMPSRSVGAMFIQIEADLASDQPRVSEDDARLDLPPPKPLTEIDIAQSPVERVLAALAEDDGAIASDSAVPSLEKSASEPNETPASDAPASIDAPVVLAAAADQPAPAINPDAERLSDEVEAEPALPDASPDDAEAAAMLAVEGAAPVRRRRRPQPVAAIAEIDAQDTKTPAAPTG